MNITFLEVVGQLALLASSIICLVIFVGNLLDVNMNEQNYAKGLTVGIRRARQYWSYKIPADFSKKMTPFYLFFTGLALIIFWDQKYDRGYLIIYSLCAFLLALALTLVYFKSQRQILKQVYQENKKQLAQDFSWHTLMDQVRNVLYLCSSLFLMVAMGKSIP